MPAPAIRQRLSQQRPLLSLTLSTMIPWSMIYCCLRPWRHPRLRIRLVERFARRQQRCVSVCRLLLLLLLLLLFAPFQPSADALSSPAQPRRETASRYFTEYFEYPPLERCSSSDMNNEVNRVVMTRANLPVLYTNDPKSVSHWLSDNVPRSGCTLGFDMEVSQFVRMPSRRAIKVRM